MLNYIMTFEEIKSDQVLFAKFTEILNNGIQFIYESREVTDNMWIVRAALGTMTNMCDNIMMERGIERKEINEFNHEMATFVDDLYTEFIVNKPNQNEKAV